MDIIILGYFSFCMIASTLSDLTTLKIPNRIILLLLIGFVIFAPFTSLTFSTFFYSHLLPSLFCLFVGFGIFAMGWMGAGDVKLIFATTLWLGLPLSIEYLFLSTILGGVFALSLLYIRTRPLPIFALKVGWITMLHGKNVGLPYGIALGPCGLYLFLHSFWLM